MSDLTDFGVDVKDPREPADTDAEPDGPSYPNGRCPVISTTTNKRCRMPVSRMKRAGDRCGTHSKVQAVDPVTIDSPPETLVMVTGDLAAPSLDVIEPDDVDFDLERIRTAVKAVREAGDE